MAEGEGFPGLKADNWPRLVSRAYAWYEKRHPDEVHQQPARVLLTTAEVALAVAKPIEERGELLGAYIKWRRAVLKGEDEDFVNELWSGSDGVLKELADELIAPLMTAAALGISKTDLFDIVERRIEDLEARPSGGRHA